MLHVAVDLHVHCTISWLAVDQFVTIFKFQVFFQDTVFLISVSVLCHSGGTIRNDAYMLNSNTKCLLMYVSHGL